MRDKAANQDNALDDHFGPEQTSETFQDAAVRLVVAAIRATRSNLAGQSDRLDMGESS